MPKIKEKFNGNVAEVRKKVVNDFEASIEKYFKEITKCKPLSRREERELWNQYKIEHNISAKNKIIQSHLQFVAKIAKSYVGRGLSYSDLIAEGNMGLIKGIERFDGREDVRPLSYAVWWIKATIQEAIEKRSGICDESLPEQKETNIDYNEYETYTDTDDTLIDKSPLSSAQVEQDEIISSMLGKLSDKENLVIRKYYGIGVPKALSLDKIALELGVSKERVRQIKERALIKMRSEAVFSYM